MALLRSLLRVVALVGLVCAASAPASAHGGTLGRRGSSVPSAPQRRPPPTTTLRPVGAQPLRTSAASVRPRWEPAPVVRGVTVVHSAPVLRSLPLVRPPAPAGAPPAVLVRRGTIVAQTAAAPAMPSATQWVRALPAALAKAPVLGRRGVLQRSPRDPNFALRFKPLPIPPALGPLPQPPITAPLPQLPGSSGAARRPTSAPASLAITKARSLETIPNLPGLNGAPALPAAASSGTRTISQLRALNYTPLRRTGSTNELPGSGYAPIPIGYGRIPEGLTAAARPATATVSEYAKAPPPVYTAAPALRRGNLERTAGITGISSLQNARAAVARNPVVVAQPKGPTVSAAAPSPN